MLWFVGAPRVTDSSERSGMLLLPSRYRPFRLAIKKTPHLRRYRCWATTRDRPYYDTKPPGETVHSRGDPLWSPSTTNLKDGYPPSHRVSMFLFMSQRIFMYMPSL